VHVFARVQAAHVAPRNVVARLHLGVLEPNLVPAQIWVLGVEAIDDRGGGGSWSRGRRRGVWGHRGGRRWPGANTQCRGAVVWTIELAPRVWKAGANNRFAAVAASNTLIMD
jgi:hypothetical protein